MATRKDTRLSRSGTDTATRRTRTSRKQTEDRTLTDAERLQEFQQSFYQSSLPDLPKIPGFHVCWLTTTNPRDSIAARLRLGYTPIKAIEIPGWDYASLKTGEYAGCIGVNEMVAFKLPNHLYEMYMREAHHRQPQLEEEKLRANTREKEEEASRVAKARVSFTEFEGNQEIGEKAPEPPPFSETLG